MDNNKLNPENNNNSNTEKKPESQVDNSQKVVDINAITENKQLNPDYYNKDGSPKYEEIIAYENQLRQQIEYETPLVSILLPIEHLSTEFENSEYTISLQTILAKYKNIRTVRRDGNCFYRAYIYRLFEEICGNKNKVLYDKLMTLLSETKNLTERQGYQWLVVEDFYNLFHNEFKFCYELDPKQTQDYLSTLFADKEKGNYFICFIRMYIAAYLKENKALYEYFVEEDFDTWVLREVETVDYECDQVQIMAIVNAFNIGVIIEYLNIKNTDTMKFPEESNEKIFIHMLYRPGHYDILYPK